jgi:hypothetical protein
MRLILTPEQAAQIEPHLRHGRTLLGKVEREPFDGSNAATCGQLRIELGSVPTSALPALRDAIRTATTTPQKPRRRAKA